MRKADEEKRKAKIVSLLGAPIRVPYLRSRSIIWYLVILGTAVTALVVILFFPDNYTWNFIRNCLGLVFVLWLPGYTFTRVLFSENVDVSEQIALSIGMSMALVPIVGLVLYNTSIGMNLESTVCTLFLLTFVFATVAFVRGHHSLKSQRLAK